MPATIQETLNARYEGVGATIGLRQESGLDHVLTGAASLAELDAFVTRRINARADRLTGVLQTAAGRYKWPFSEATLAKAYPNQDATERANTARLMLEIAADSVASGVLGDLYSRAAPRDERYADQRNFYIGNPEIRGDNGEAGRLADDVANMVAAAYTEDPTTSDQKNQLRVITPTDPLTAIGGRRGEYLPERDF